MSAKSVDSKGRFRSKTIAFRVSPAEKKAINDRAKLCGYQNMQYFLLDSLLHQQIKAEANPLMLTRFRVQLFAILEELKRIESGNKIDEELFEPLKTMLQILHSFEAKEKKKEMER